MEFVWFFLGVCSGICISWGVQRLSEKRNNIKEDITNDVYQLGSQKRKVPHRRH